MKNKSLAKNRKLKKWVSGKISIQATTYLYPRLAEEAKVTGEFFSSAAFISSALRRTLRRRVV